MPLPGHLSVQFNTYVVSKAAVGALSKSLETQLAAEGIRSSAIFPSLTFIPLQSRWDTGEKVMSIGLLVPLESAK